MKCGQITRTGVKRQEFLDLVQKFQTKPELALKLVMRAIDSGIEFDFIAGDGLYGQNVEPTRA